MWGGGEGEGGREGVGWGGEVVVVNLMFHDYTIRARAHTKHEIAGFRCYVKQLKNCFFCRGSNLRIIGLIQS